MYSETQEGGNYELQGRMFWSTSGGIRRSRRYTLRQRSQDSPSFVSNGWRHHLHATGLGPTRTSGQAMHHPRSLVFGDHSGPQKFITNGFGQSFSAAASSSQR